MTPPHGEDRHLSLPEHDDENEGQDALSVDEERLLAAEDDGLDLGAPPDAPDEAVQRRSSARGALAIVVQVATGGRPPS